MSARWKVGWVPWIIGGWAMGLNNRFALVARSLVDPHRKRVMEHVTLSEGSGA